MQRCFTSVATRCVLCSDVVRALQEGAFCVTMFYKRSSKVRFVWRRCTGIARGCILCSDVVRRKVHFAKRYCVEHSGIAAEDDSDAWQGAEKFVIMDDSDVWQGAEKFVIMDDRDAWQGAEKFVVMDDSDAWQGAEKLVIRGDGNIRQGAEIFIVIEMEKSAGVSLQGQFAQGKGSGYEAYRYQ